MALVNKTTPEGKGVRTGYQAFFGSILAFITGLVAVVWAVPGVPEAVQTYLLDNAAQWALALGLTSGAFGGIIAYLQNKAKK